RQVDAQRLQLMDPTAAIRWLPETTQKEQAEAVDNILPLHLQRATDGSWNVIGTLQFGNSFDHITAHISPGGDVDIVADQSLDENFPLVVEQFANGVRQLRSPLDEQLWDWRAGQAEEKKQWADAVAAQIKFIAAIENNSADNPARKSRLTVAYQDLAWDQLMMKDFTSALASAQMGLQADPTHLLNAVDQAHALLFLGRTDEARKIYLNPDYIGHKVGGATSQNWENVVLGDFGRFTDLGLSSPSISDIQQQLEQAKSAVKVDQDKADITRLLAEPDSDTTKKSDLVEAYHGLSWDELMIKDFAGALAAAQNGLQLDSGNLHLEANRAHALLFLGRTDEAEQIYYAHMGEKMDSDSTENWEDTIIYDFDDFASAKLENPEIATIREKMEAAKTTARITRDKADIARLLALPDATSDKKSRLLDAYRYLSRDELYLKDFTSALATADEGLQLDPKNLPLLASRAHALLFLGRTDEAEQIYFAHLGETTESMFDDTWEDVVLDDFDDFASENLANPNLASISTSLESSRAKGRVTRDLADITRIQAEPDGTADKKSDLADAYQSLAWNDLFVQDFAGALAAAESGLQLDPGNLSQETNRAHALLFLGRVDEARQMYLGNRGKPMEAGSERKWEDAILGDFDLLEAAGVTSPEIAGLRAALKAPAP
ncbi:MAG TPA: hypothetical protein VK737_11890, partial [Opitutales bacterium]|nr:hypothetical protein [Opitutales bacterium]